MIVSQEKVIKHSPIRTDSVSSSPLRGVVFPTVGSKRSRVVLCSARVASRSARVRRSDEQRATPETTDDCCRS